MGQSETSDRLQLVPVAIKEAMSYVEQHHRHHLPPNGGLFAVGVEYGGEVCGVVIVARPVARLLWDGYTAEVTRCCTDGTRNAPSMLYRAAWRACKALGYRRLVTYTLPVEGGASLRAAGFRLIGEAGGGSWHRATRPRVDMHPTQEKLRWEVVC
jgi:hypothetical protein